MVKYKQQKKKEHQGEFKNARNYNDHEDDDDDIAVVEDMQQKKTQG